MLRVAGSESARDEVDGRSLLDEIAREGARQMLVAALETEVAAYLEAHGDERDDEGHALVVRNGKGRTRKVMLGAATIPVSAPRVNEPVDRSPWRTATLHEPHPTAVHAPFPEGRRGAVLYLRGLSTGDFREALAALLGDDAARDEGCGLANERAVDGLQAPRHGAGPVATARRRAAYVARSRWCRLRGRCAAGEQARQAPSTSRVEHPSHLSIHLSVSTLKFGRLSESIVDRANLSRSFFGDQQFMRLHASAIGRKSTVCPKV
jgi:hypothetical protein